MLLDQDNILRLTLSSMVTVSGVLLAGWARMWIINGDTQTAAWVSGEHSWLIPAWLLVPLSAGVSPGSLLPCRSPGPQRLRAPNVFLSFFANIDQDLIRKPRFALFFWHYKTEFLLQVLTQQHKLLLFILHYQFVWDIFRFMWLRARSCKRLCSAHRLLMRRTNIESDANPLPTPPTAE